MTDRDPQSQTSTTARRPAAWLGWAVFSAAVVVTLLFWLLATSILERREEARQRPPLAPIAEFEPDSSRWGVNYPRQYDSYKRMADDKRLTKYGGGLPRDYLEETPANIVLFAGYGFSKHYQQARGHVHAITDVTHSPRVTPKTPATCFTCKSPDVPRLMAQMGPEKFYASSFAELKEQITHPIGCADCHQPDTMALRITRPALREAWKRQGKDIDSASHQEMRTLVCAQCHVEYYFKGEGNYLTFPWDKGTAEEIEKYYNDQDFGLDHAVSKTKMLKMQHPTTRFTGRESTRIATWLCGLPHAVPHRGRGEVHRPSRAKPAV